MQICENCGASFPHALTIGGIRLNVRGRKRCLSCKPHHPQRKPRRSVPRPVTLKTCDACGAPFPARLLIDGKVRSFQRRHFCLDCSPFGAHNSSKTPPRIGDREELAEYRRRRRNAKTYRHQKKKRTQRKLDLVQARGGKCEDCGYAGHVAVLEFHHRDPCTKEFGIGAFAGSKARLEAEVAKCDLLCVNCHRRRHLRFDQKGHEVVEFRRRAKLRAVALFEGTCAGCDSSHPPGVFEFHHRDASEKDFGISNNGIPLPWQKVVAELAKCVMLCANCHREVHAGVREIDEGLLGLAEPAAPYAA